MASTTLAENGNSNNGFPALSLVQGHPRASSLTIAEHFGKQHKNVLRAIAQIKLNLPEEFNRLNFEPVEFDDSKGEKRSAILMTRDGFTVVVMGFTGKDAMKWKLRYIEAFNRMEEELRGQQAALPSTITPAQQQELHNIVAAKASAYPKDQQRSVHQQMWGRFHNKFHLSKYSQLPYDKFPEAVEYLVKMAVRAELPAAEEQKALPAAKDTTVRDYARLYKSLPPDLALWKGLKYRLYRASSDYGKELAEIRELAGKPFKTNRKSDIGTFFDSVLEPIETLLRAAEASEHAVFCHFNAALEGYMAAHNFLTRG